MDVHAHSEVAAGLRGLCVGAGLIGTALYGDDPTARQRRGCTHHGVAVGSLAMRPTL
jgi:hypothetical protein